MYTKKTIAQHQLNHNRTQQNERQKNRRLISRKRYEMKTIQMNNIDSSLINGSRYFKNQKRKNHKHKTNCTALAVMTLTAYAIRKLYRRKYIAVPSIFFIARRLYKMETQNNREMDRNWFHSNAAISTFYKFVLRRGEEKIWQRLGRTIITDDG